MIKFEQVQQSYTGRVGCMCGCNGKYSIASHWGVEAANKDVGYEGYDKTNDRAVKLAVNKINKLLDWNNPKDVTNHVEFNNDGTAMCAWYNHGKDDGRIVVVYFTDGTTI